MLLLDCMQFQCSETNIHIFSHFKIYFYYQIVTPQFLILLPGKSIGNQYGDYLDLCVSCLFKL